MTTQKRDPALEGPMAGSVRLGFLMLYALVILLGAAWASGNIHQVPPDSRAVVFRFGRVNRVQEAGLLLAWPSPIEQVRMLPAADRQIAYNVRAQETGFQSDETDIQFAPNDDVIHMQGERDLFNATYIMTGDGNVVSLHATLFYTITDPTAYLLVEKHVLPALQRIYQACAVSLTASRQLDDFLVAQLDEDMAGPGAAAATGLAARRQALRSDLVAAINARLNDLRRSGGDLGISVSRADLVAVLPPVAKAAFDGVLTAAQIADQNAAAAHTDAEHITQEANQQRDAIVSAAAAAADERIKTAMSDTAPVGALEMQESAADRNTLLIHAYQDEIALILQRAGEVTVIDPRSAQQVLLPGPTP
ncbi:MAG TPA: SPFH domain-containing protein [Acidisoma sp.]|jgi:regulator of protease activity HflC (stomatin/prohibitin superfamily)|nr:SPFH domain-containing protein [Acidisoma sp.]